MNKTELVKIIAENADLTSKQAAAAVDAAINAIEDAVAAGDKVNVTGFGIFERRERAARTGRNPRTKEVVEIPATAVPAFKPGKAFKEKVNG